MNNSETDRRLLAAAVRLSRRHLGLTGTNPSVATILVRFDQGNIRIVGRGITAIGGRPHAERLALGEAGDLARGATAYVTLEPCAHHGQTPPCAQALIDAGVSRVVSNVSDPDDRVSGRGYEMLRAAGIQVEIVSDQELPNNVLRPYLIRNSKKRPEVTVKMAISVDGKIGIQHAGQVPVTGAQTRARTHLLRAQSDAIMVGIGTVLEDDPQLTCRLDGLNMRSPSRIIVDSQLRLPLDSKLVTSARQVPTFVAALPGISSDKLAALQAHGVRYLATDGDEQIAMPELMEDLASLGISTVMVEGGASLVTSLMKQHLVDRLMVFDGPHAIGEGAIDAPLDLINIPDEFTCSRRAVYGQDQMAEYVRKCE